MKPTPRNSRIAAALLLLCTVFAPVHSAWAAPVQFTVFLFDNAGTPSGTGTFTVDDTLLQANGPVPVTDLQIVLEGPTTVFAFPVGNVEAIVDTSTQTRIRRFNNAQVGAGSRGDIITLEDGPLIPPVGFPYSVAPGAVPGPHAGETGSYVVRTNTVPEPGTVGLLLGGLAGIGVIGRRRSRKHRERAQ